MTVSALDRKLLRDVWKMRGQATAIALVIAAGVSMFVAYQSTFQSLRRTQETYYDRQRFADVFASLKRAPARVESRIAAIRGVATVQTRVVAQVTLDLPGVSEPARARLISIPAVGRPTLNDVFLRRGRWIDPARSDEVLVSEAFALANDLEPGSTLAAIVNGRRRELRIVGIALTPEYIYNIPPGEIIPDDRRFGILWMERKALASAFDMEGGFNDVALRIMHGAHVEDVIARLDRILRPYGGLGAIPRRLQFSHWSLNSELEQLQSFGVMIPMIFFGVAAFILNVALTRALTLQRPQIASLKALGYSNRELAWHYLKWALLIGLLGTALGTISGAWLGSAMIDLYNLYFRFPVLSYQLSVGVTIASVLVSLAMAALGALAAVRRAVRLPPAEAMRAEPPARYRPSLAERGALRNRLTHATRMILRNIERQPFRSAASVVGIAFAVAILVMGYGFADMMEILKDMQFSRAQRHDVMVTFAEPASARALYELRSLPGVEQVEPLRAVPARLRAGHRYRNVAVQGITRAPSLNRIVDRDGNIVSIPPEGLLISRMLGEILGARAGDLLTLEVLEGARPTRTVPVAALVDDILGLSVYMRDEALHRLMREGRTLSGGFLQVDRGQMDELYVRLKHTPAVAGVSLTANALRSFEETMSTNMNTMIVVNIIFAGIIAFGVVYNAARISLSERSHELASLRVLGFTRAEISLILLGELALLTLASLPVGALLGYGLTWSIVRSIDSEVYRFPFVLTMQAVAQSFLVLVIAATLSGLAVRRKLDRLDLIAVLKTRE